MKEREGDFMQVNLKNFEIKENAESIDGALESNQRFCDQSE